MINYLKEINNGLIIERPKILLPWGLLKKDVFDKINGIDVVDKNYYTIRIVLSGIDFINCAGLHFKNERLSEVDLFDSEKYCSESEIGNTFNTHQLVLEKFFGKASRNKISEKFKGVNKEYRWKFKHVTIIHKLWDRFGMEEVMKIYINNINSL